MTVNDSVPIPIMSPEENPSTSVTNIDVLTPVIALVFKNCESPTDLLITLTFLGPLNSVKSEVLIPLNINVSPSVTPCGVLVIPVILFLSFASSVSTNVDTPICTVEMGLPKTDPTTIFAPPPSVPALSSCKTSSTL